jgi:hypothetical protein
VILFTTYESFKQYQHHFVLGVRSTVLSSRLPTSLSVPYFTNTPRDDGDSSASCDTYINDDNRSSASSRNSSRSSGNIINNSSDAMDSDDDPMTITTVRSTLFGGVSGALAGFLTTPFDVIKTKVMTSQAAYAAGAARDGVASTRMLDVARQLYSAQKAILTASKSTSAAMPAGVVADTAPHVGSRIAAAIGPSSVFFTGAAARSVWWFGICSIFFPVSNL